MIKIRTIKVKNIKNKAIRMVIRMIKIIITTLIMTMIKIMMTKMRIKIGNRIKIKNR